MISLECVLTYSTPSNPTQSFCGANGTYMRNGREEMGRGRKKGGETVHSKRAIFLQLYKFLQTFLSHLFFFSATHFLHRDGYHTRHFDGLHFSKKKKDFMLCFHWKLRVKSFKFRFVDLDRTKERSLRTTTWDLDEPFFFHIFATFSGLVAT